MPTSPNSGYLEGANLAGSTDTLKSPEPRIINVGEVLKVRIYPYGGIDEIREGTALRDGETVYEVTVTSVKKLVINYE